MLAPNGAPILEILPECLSLSCDTLGQKRVRARESGELLEHPPFVLSKELHVHRTYIKRP